MRIHLHFVVLISIMLPTPASAHIDTQAHICTYILFMCVYILNHISTYDPSSVILTYIDTQVLTFPGLLSLLLHVYHIIFLLFVLVNL